MLSNIRCDDDVIVTGIDEVSWGITVNINKNYLFENYLFEKLFI